MSKDKLGASWYSKRRGKREGRCHFRNLGESGRIILKCVLKTNNVKMCPEIAWFGIWSSDVNEPSGWSGRSLKLVNLECMQLYFRTSYYIPFERVYCFTVQYVEYVWRSPSCYQMVQGKLFPGYINLNILIDVPCIFYYFVQGDQKVSVHLMVTIQKSGAQRPFDHPVLWPTNAQSSHKLSHSTPNQIQYIPGHHDSSINRKTVYTAYTQSGFMRIVAFDFSPFCCKQDNCNVLMILKYWDFNDYSMRTCIKPMWNILIVLPTAAFEILV
jgi:hypothetical protein